MINAQQWLDNNYPKKERKEIKELEIHLNKLEGDLDLNDFVSLEKLDCRWNKLISLDLGKFLKLKKLIVLIIN